MQGHLTLIFLTLCQLLDEDTYTPEYFSSEDSKKYDWTQTYTFMVPKTFNPNQIISQNLDNLDSLEDYIEIDDRFIEVE